MAASITSSAAITSVGRRNPVQASLSSSFTKSTPFPGSKRAARPSKLPSKSLTVRCMKVWPPLGLKKFETLSYLPPLTEEELLKEIDYLLRSKWIPCLEFEVGDPYPSRNNNRSPGYYDGRYWTMWKLPMYGCTDSAQVLKEVKEASTEYPQAHVRIIGFDNVRQVQCCSFLAYRPPS